MRSAAGADVEAGLGVALDELELSSRKGARLGEDLSGDDDHTDVVKLAGDSHAAALEDDIARARFV